MTDQPSVTDQSSYLETLRRIASGMAPGQGFQTTLLAILDLLATRHGFLRAHLVIFDPESRTLRLCVSEDTPRSTDSSYEPGIGVTGQVFTSGKPVILECLRDAPGFLGKFFARKPEELASLAFLSVPVLAPSLPNRLDETRRILGVLSVDTPRAERAVLELHCRFLEVVAGLIASQAAYLQEEMARQRHMDTLPDAMTATTTSLRPVAVSSAMRSALDLASRAAHGRSALLLTGEDGVGKAYLAAYIHALSERRTMPMIRFDCSCTEQSSDSHLLFLERELFGYCKGAFAGASQTRKGLFELAQCSSLFLEHIDRVPPQLFDRLLQTLQEQMVRRIGGGQPIPVDVRLICSSHRGVDALVAEGCFPEELFRRIATVTIPLPPLRERPEDILPLAKVFLQSAAENAMRTTPALSESVAECLSGYCWPGNSDELARCIEQALSVCTGSVIQQEHLPSSLMTSHAELSFTDAVALFERQIITDALQKSKGNMLQAARLLRTTYRIVNYKIKKYHIDPRTFQV